MKKVLRTGDPVRLSNAMELLEAAECRPVTPQRFGNAALDRIILAPEDCVELAVNALKALDT